MITYGITQIKASAGSGKTYRLTELFLESLSTLKPTSHNIASLRYELRNIIAMTFTNKAVSEMKHAILKRLKTIALNQDQGSLSPQEALIWVDCILEAYSTLRIQSIDSTILQLLRSLSLHLGLSNTCTPILGNEEIYIMDMLYTQYIEQALHNEDIASTIYNACKILADEAHTFSSIHKTLKQYTLDLVKMIIERGIFLQESSETIETLLTTYEHDIALLHRYYGKEVQKKEFHFLIRALRTAIENHGITGTHSNFNKALDKDDYSTTSHMLVKDSFNDVLTKSGKAHISEESLAYMEGLYAQLRSNILRRDAIVYPISRALQYTPLIRIAYTIIDMIRIYQQKENTILFSSVHAMLAQYFSSNVHLYESLSHIGEHIHTIFFDEFQDTSRAQWNALFPIIENVLANGGSFIYVGDIKQAIYSWRGGDASLFESIYAEMHYEKTKEVLPYNWRSAAPIVNLANIFSEIEYEHHAYGFLYTLFSENTQQKLQKMPAIVSQGIAKLMESYTKGKQAISTKTKHMKGRIRITELLPIENQEQDEEKIQEEARIQQELYSSLMDYIPHTKLSDIAILTRTNIEANLVSTWLLEWNIPHTLEGGIVLYSIPIIQHIILMLKFIQTQSAYSFYGVLSSLLCRDYLLSEQECMLWRSKARHSNIITSFQASYPELWKMYFEPFIVQYATYTPYQYIQECIRCFSLYERFPYYSLYLDTFLEIAFHTDIKKTSSLSQFLSEFELHKDDHKVTPMSSLNAIQILTIHKSKGLEFPIVYLPFTKETSQRTRMEVNLYPVYDILGEESHSIPELNDILDSFIFTQVNSHNQSYHKACIDSAIEKINLLYVALTRAKYELHIIIHPHNTPEYSFSRIIQHIITHQEFIPKHNITQIITTPERTVYEYSTLDMQYKKDIIEEKCDIKKTPHIPEEHTPYTITVLPPFDIDTPAQSTLATSQEAFILLEDFPDIALPHSTEHTAQIERGIILHKALEYISYGYRIEDALLTSYPHTTEYAHLHDNLSKRLVWFTTQEFAQECLSTGMIEQRMRTQEGKELRADKIIEYDDEWLVIEYKTGYARQEHIEQVIEYMNVLTAIRSKASRAFLIYFDEQYDIPSPPDNIAIYSYTNTF